MENMLAPTTHANLINESHAEVDAIKTAAGLTDQQFAALCMPVLRSYADQVQRLPLSISAFASPRGAWDFGLTAAMVAYRYSGTLIFFPSLGAEERRRLEPQCRYMAFIATLATAIASVAESCSITAGDDEYHPLCTDSSLFTWLSANHRIAKFEWRVPAAPLTVQACAAIAAKFIPNGLMGAFDLRTVLMMYEAITPKSTMNGVESTLARVVRESTQRVLDHYRSKQAGAFQPEQGAAQISMADAEMIAKKMAAVANPKTVPNPLEAPAPASAPGHGAQADAGSAPSLVKVEDSMSRESLATQPAASSAAATSMPDLEGSDILNRANKVLREWFQSLQQHPNFHMLKTDLEMTEEGITVPTSMLGLFGVSSPSIRKMMDEAGLIVRRSDNARGLILHPALRKHFVSAEN